MSERAAAEDLGIRPLDVVAGAAALVTVVGTLGPWQTLNLGGNLRGVSLAGTTNGNHGWLAIFAALACAGMLIVRGRMTTNPSILVWGPVSAAGIALATMGYSYENRHSGLLGFVDTFSTGWGFWVALAGASALLVISGLTAISRPGAPGSPTRPDQSSELGYRQFQGPWVEIGGKRSDSDAE